MGSFSVLLAANAKHSAGLELLKENQTDHLPPPQTAIKSRQPTTQIPSLNVTIYKADTVLVKYPSSFITETTGREQRI